MYIYRFFFSKIPNYIYTRVSKIRFTHRQVITIKETSLKIVVDPKNGTTDTELFLKRERDTDVVNLMKKYCTPGSTFIDIGANIGYETLWGASLVGPSGAVYAFEPIPRLVSQIKESISHNIFSNITIVPKACGEKEAVSTIYFHEEDAGLTSLANNIGSTEQTTVQVTTLDKELEGAGHVSMIKVDVEGYEYEALLGGEKVIAKNKPYIIFEFSPHLYEKDYEGKSIELLSFLSKKGYHIYFLDNLEDEIEESMFTKVITKVLEDETIPNCIASPVIL